MEYASGQFRSPVSVVLFCSAITQQLPLRGPVTEVYSDHRNANVKQRRVIPRVLGFFPVVTAQDSRQSSSRF